MNPGLLDHYRTFYSAKKITIIFRKIYLTHSWDPDKYYPSGLKWTWEQWHTLQISWTEASPFSYLHTLFYNEGKHDILSKTTANTSLFKYVHNEDYNSQLECHQGSHSLNEGQITLFISIIGKVTLNEDSSATLFLRFNWQMRSRVWVASTWPVLIKGVAIHLFILPEGW